MMDLGRQGRTAAHWSRQQYESVFVIAGHEATSNRVAWVVEDDCIAQREKAPGKTPEILAFLVAHRIDIHPEWELENIVVAEAVRRQGLGTLLLREFVAHARAEQGAAIFLEVRESNQRAHALYEKFGFQKAGFRKDYYASPAESAILYRLNIV